jgi:DNA-3-methyladenine glycosylase
MPSRPDPPAPPPAPGQDQQRAPLVPLGRAFYARDTRVVARALIGKVLVAPEGRARIVETEAYHGRADAASHAHRGPTARNAPMFGPPGHAYVYLIYGMWHCFNVVTMASGTPAAVLVRAGLLLTDDDPAEPPGIDDGRRRAPRAPRAAAGPGRLCRTLGIDRSASGADLTVRGALWIGDDGAAPARLPLGRGPRIGVDYAGPWAQKPWRYWWRDHPAVSR